VGINQTTFKVNSQFVMIYSVSQKKLQPSPGVFWNLLFKNWTFSTHRPILRSNLHQTTVRCVQLSVAIWQSYTVYYVRSHREY